MGLFSNQLLNVIEWNETRDDILFWLWPNDEIKKNSRLIIRPGQDAIFLNSGRIEGIFKDEGNYEIETEIIPFLTTLKGYKFGFKSGLKAEVLFVNTKEFQVKWGTKSPINIPSPNMPGGIPIRAFGSFSVKVSDYLTLIDRVVGIKRLYTVDDVKLRVLAMLDQLIMKWIVREGKDMFNLQANSFDIARGIKEDLDMEMTKIGLTITNLNIENINYPEGIQKMVEKNAAYSMVGNIGHYQNVSMVESMEKNNANPMTNMAQAGMGMQMGMQMMKDMQNNMETSKRQNESSQLNNDSLKKSDYSCINCGEGINEADKFCSNCGTDTKPSKENKSKAKFCSECGSKVDSDSKFCSNCGKKII